MRMIGDFTFPGLLDTPRLGLRPYSNVDAPAVLDLINTNREQLRRNFAPIAKGVLQAADAVSFVKENADKWTSRKEFCYGIWHRQSKELVGQIKAKNIIWEVPAAELSYFIGVSAQRRGFATEAVSALLRLAIGQLRFRRICLRIISSNKESLLLAEKLGFKHEGLHRNEFRCGFGELHDVYHYSVTDADTAPIITGP
jgi:ribosomal-protein-alanine N-acetyltransferase